MKKVTIYEVGPRDGFQNQKKWIETKDKLEIIDRIVQSGVKSIQITSFMSPKAIPQTADAAEIAETCLKRYPQLTLSALVPNLRGADRAVAAGLRRIFCVASLSETHNLRNINRTHEQSMREFLELREKYPDIHITLDLATTFGCPFEGKKETEEALAFAKAYVEAGVDEIDLCDTIGIADPGQVRRLIAAMKAEFPQLPLQVHIHDTRNMGMVNTLAAIEAGADTVQSTLGGLGGCPFAPGASGNLATEDLLFMLDGMGYETGVDFAQLLAAARVERQLLGEGNFSGHQLQIETSSCAFVNEHK